MRKNLVSLVTPCLMYRKSFSHFSIFNNFALLKRQVSASVLDNRIVSIQINEIDKEPMKFPNVWLRDNCQCPECFHDNTKSRKVIWKRAISNHHVSSVTVQESQNAIVIDWQDKHQSVFGLKWLKERDFSPDQRKHYLNEVYKPPAQMWGKKDLNKVWRTFEFEKVIKDEDVLLAWLKTLAERGFALIKNAPHDKTISRQLANRIGFVKRTTYGELFEVKSKENARNYAYLMTPLGLHTDMCYNEYKAGINILHCFVQSQSTGGSNTLTDGFYVAEKLKRDFPKFYDILLRTPVDWYDVGEDNGMEFHNIWRGPVICLDIDGNYHRIDHNITKRDSHFTIPLEMVEPWYEAYDKFLQLAYEESVEFKTTSGDVFVFNNLRMLHGRTAYEDSPANKRHLIGAYVDWDIIYSKMRVIKSKVMEKGEAV